VAITYVGGVTGGRAGATTTTTQSISTTLTGGLATSPSTGDLVVVYCSAAADGTANPANQSVSGNTSGAYSTATYQQANGTTYDTNSQLNYQFMGATPDTTLTIPSSGNARNAQRWVVHVFRNVDSATPLDVAVQPASGTGTGRPVPAGIQPTTAGAWIVAFYASAAGTGTAFTAPTELVDWLGNTQVDTADCMQGGGYYASWSSGTYTPQAITAGGTTNAADSWTAMSVALRPSVIDYPLTANSGSYTYTGSSATVSRNRALTSSSGSYTYTGSSSTITKGYPITASAGSYTYSGSSATIQRSRELAASAGSYTYTGSSSPLSLGYTLTALAGSYAYTGSNIEITYTVGSIDYPLTAQSGIYAYNGQTITITHDIEEVEILAGGGYPVFKKKKPYKRIDDIVEKTMRELYEEITEEASPKIKKQAVKIVKPYVASVTKQSTIPTATLVDWNKFDKDLERVSALLELWQEQQESSEDEEMLLFVLAA